VKSYQYPAAVRDYSKAKGMARLVMYALATRVGDDGICFPSYATLLADTGLSLSGLRKALKAIPVDELQVVQKGRATGYPTKYRLTINCGQSDHSQESHCVSTEHSQGINHVPTKHSSRNNCAPTEHSTASRQVTNCVPTEHLTTKELPIKLPKARKRASGVSALSSKNGSEDPEIPPILQTPLFLKTWAVFDNYRRNGKAQKAWTPHAKEIALKVCLKLGPAAAVTAIERSIMSGWTGIFEPNNHNQKPKRSVDEFGLPNL
jgi:hypothetical protein